MVVCNVYVATGIVTGRRTKKETSLKRDWSRHHSYFWRTMENHKNKASLRKNQSFGFGSRLRIGKVLAPYSARPRAVPLIKHAKLM